MVQDSETKTLAQAQIEYLLRLKKKAEGKPGEWKKEDTGQGVPGGKAVPSVKRKIQLDGELWKRMQKRQKETREFARERDLWDWALELVLAFPVGTHRLSKEEKRTLFSKAQILVNTER